MPIRPISDVQLPGNLAFRSLMPVEGVYPGVPTDVGLESMFDEYAPIVSWTSYSHGYPGPLTEEEEENYHSGSFNPLDANKGSTYQLKHQLEEVATARSPRELDWMYANFERSNDNREMIAKMNTWQDIWMSVVVGGSDPITLATLLMWPVAPAALGAKIFSSTKLGAAAMAVPEFALHATQPHRTLEESMNYTIAGAVMGAMFGPWAKGKTPSVSDKTKKEIFDLLVKGDVGVRAATPDYVPPAGAGGSVGAAKVGADRRIPPGLRQELDQKVLSGEMSSIDAARTLRDAELAWTQVKYPRASRVIAFFSPAVRLATGPFTTARYLGEEIVEDSLVRQANKFGYTTRDYSIETLSGSQIQPLRVAVNDAMRGQYEKYVGERAFSKFAPENMQAKSRGIMTFDEFKDEIGKAQSQGNKHNNPHVQAAAIELRKQHKIFEKQLLDEGLIPQRMDEIEVEVPAMVVPDDPQYKLKLEGGTVHKVKKVKQKVPSGEAKVPHGDESYFPRMWNQKAVIEGYTELRQIITKEATKDMDADALKRFWDPVHQLEYQAKLDDILQNIMGRPLGRMDGNIVPQTGFLKERKLRISTALVQDYLHLDPGLVWYAYYRDMVPRLEMTRKFGSYDLAEQLTALDKEAQGMLKNAKTPKDRIKINKQYKAARRDVMAMRDMVLNRYANPNDPNSWIVNVGRNIRTWNALTSLGGMMLAAVPDIGIMATRMGIDKTIKGGMLLGKSILKDHKNGTYSTRFIKSVGGALDVTLNNRNQAMMMMDEVVGGHKLLDKMVRRFSTLTGMAHWNAGMQNIVGLVMINDLGGVVLSKRLPSAAKMQRMAQVYGIDKRMWKRIQKEWTEHGIMDGGLRVPEFAKWKDKEAMRSLQSAFFKEMRTSVIFPGMGDLPLASRNELGKLIYQFKSFPLSATTKFMLSTIQNANLAPVNTAASLLTVTLPLGVVSYYIKQIVAGHEPSTDFNVIAREAIDRSGMFGIYTDLNAITEKMTRGQVGLMRLMGGEPLTRRAAQSVIGDILGPSFGKFGDAAASVGAVSDLIAGEGVSEGDIRRLRRLIPYQNLFWIRNTLNQVEESITR